VQVNPIKVAILGTVLAVIGFIAKHIPVYGPYTIPAINNVMINGRVTAAYHGPSYSTIGWAEFLTGGMILVGAIMTGIVIAVHLAILISHYMESK
jgi:hypothetical protein